MAFPLGRTVCPAFPRDCPLFCMGLCGLLGVTGAGVVFGGKYIFLMGNMDGAVVRIGGANDGLFRGVMFCIAPRCNDLGTGRLGHTTTGFSFGCGSTFIRGSLEGEVGGGELVGSLIVSKVLLLVAIYNILLLFL